MSVEFTPLSPLPLPGPARISGEKPDLEKVAKEFEALFLAQMLKIMRESVGSSGLLEEAPGKDIYRELMDHELARSLAARGGLGLAKLFLQGVQQRQAKEGAPPEISSAASVPRSTSSYRVSSELGWRRDPITAETRFHRGVDLAAPAGTQVLSRTEGKVVFSGRQGSYGNTVVIENQEGVRTRYAHLQEVAVRTGEEVSRKQVIGKVGSTGRATGPHLHLEMEKDGRLLHPLQLASAD